MQKLVKKHKKNLLMTDQINKNITLFTFVKLGKEVKEKYIFVIRFFYIKFLYMSLLLELYYVARLVFGLDATDLDQGCPTGGPGAVGGPRQLFLTLF